ncbi:hypothetical protein [Luteolibacter sp. AS25]|uniref:hypothetical protein n=1 Tax=Luteolibacter sp. AS25 TaxID=3135776 RepID=UPI00398B67AD
MMISLMACKWKKQPDAQCACAFRLTAGTEQIVRDFTTLGQTTLVLREPGLSLSKYTNSPSQEVDAHSPMLMEGSDLYLLRDHETSKPTLAVARPGKTVSCTLRLEALEWNSPILRKFLLESIPKPVACPDARNLGAGFWMDDFGPKCAENTDHLLAREACQTIRHCQHLEIHLQAETCHIHTSCKPSFVDSERNIIRISDRACRTVVYADAGDPDFRLSYLADNKLQLTRHRATTPLPLQIR